MSKTTIEIALAGNPNSGKTSTFNVLTGSNQFVGNWPGVTVERKSGFYKKNKTVELQDLPGIYSMSPYTPEEKVARNYLLSNQPQAILNIVDGTNLERNLYLTTQLIETGIPVVLGLNMMDIVEKQGKQINAEKLSDSLGIPVVEMSALKNKGLDKALKKALHEIEHRREVSFPTYDARLEVALDEILTCLGNSVPEKQARWHALKLFEKDELAWSSLELSSMQTKEINEIIQMTEKIFDDDSESIVVNERYELITQITALCHGKRGSMAFTLSDKIDRVVTNRFVALPIFAMIMWLVYSISIQWIGVPITDWLNDNLFGEALPDFLTKYMEQWQVAEWMQSLVLDGVIAGGTAVVAFIPQIAVLFFCLGILEDCGYMSRIAFVLDRLFRKFGLSGKSFIPMLMATGCGVTGIMASRTIESEKDRRISIMVTTFIPCSAKLPIIALIAGAFFPNSSWVAPSAYLVGIASIILSGIALKKTRALSSKATPFIMELPSYHVPRLRNIFRYAWDNASEFVKRATTIIFVSNLFIWFTSSFSWTMQPVEAGDSILASVGKFLSPLFAPLGWGNWQGTVATITGLVAKETVVATFGVLFKGLTEVSEEGTEIWGNLHGSFTALSAYSFLLFNLLCAPCFAAIGAVYREMNALKWTVTAIAYQCGLAYAVGFIVYQLGHVFFEKAQPTILTYLAGGVFLFIVWALVRKPAQEKEEVISMESLMKKV